MGIEELIDGLEEMMRVYHMMNDIGYTAVSTATSVLAAFTAIISLMICFFGYKMFKLMVAIVGCIAGFIGGAILGLALGAEGFALVTALAGAILLTFLAFKLYKIGVFLYCGFLPGVLFALLIDPVVGIFAFLIFGVLGVILTRPYIIGVTSISSGFIAGNSILIVFNISNPGASILVGALIAVLGFMYQWKTTAGNVKVTQQKGTIHQAATEAKPQAKNYNYPLILAAALLAIGVLFRSPIIVIFGLAVLIIGWLRKGEKLPTVQTEEADGSHVVTVKTQNENRDTDTDQQTAPEQPAQAAKTTQPNQFPKPSLPKVDQEKAGKVIETILVSIMAIIMTVILACQEIMKKAAASKLGKYISSIQDDKLIKASAYMAVAAPLLHVISGQIGYYRDDLFSFENLFILLFGCLCAYAVLKSNLKLLLAVTATEAVYYMIHFRPWFGMLSLYRAVGLAILAFSVIIALTLLKNPYKSWAFKLWAIPGIIMLAAAIYDMSNWYRYELASDALESLGIVVFGMSFFAFGYYIKRASQREDQAGDRENEREELQGGAVEALPDIPQETATDTSQEIALNKSIQKRKENIGALKLKNGKKMVALAGIALTVIVIAGAVLTLKEKKTADHEELINSFQSYNMAGRWIAEGEGETFNILYYMDRNFDYHFKTDYQGNEIDVNLKNCIVYDKDSYQNHPLYRYTDSGTTLDLYYFEKLDDNNIKASVNISYGNYGVNDISSPMVTLTKAPLSDRDEYTQSLSDKCSNYYGRTFDVVKMKFDGDAPGESISSISAGYDGFIHGTATVLDTAGFKENGSLRLHELEWVINPLNNTWDYIYDISGSKWILS